MQIPKLKTSFTRFTDANLKRKAQSIVLAMKDNVNFPDSAPMLQTLTNTVNQYADALAAALEGGRIQKSEKNKLRLTLEEELRNLAAYVTHIAQADKPMLIGSGFDLVKAPEPAPELPAPHNIIAASGINPGEVLISVNGVGGARSYSHEYAPDPLTDNSIWTIELDSVRKHLFTGLVRGKKYWFRVATIGTRGKKNYSNEINCFVQ